MAHTYYKDRLGFEPEYESRLQQSSSQHQTSVTKSTLYSSGISQSSTQQRSSNYQTKATIHEASHSASTSSNNHYSSSRIQHGSSENHSSGALESTQHSSSGGGGHGVYEENLTKFKDERDAIQKKTFTKWANKHLKKAGRHCRDLFEDLRDGHNLLSLLEVLSGEILPRERGRMRFHAIQNVETALRFLRYKEIKLVNIRGEDIVDGNPKLTLGLIWTIILHFQISDIVVGQEDANAKEALLRWAQKTTHRYPNVAVHDFSHTWRDGLAFNAILHRNRPDLIDWKKVERRQVRERIDTMFHIMEKEYGVTRLLDPEDVDTPEPDEKSIITYVSQLYDVFPEPPPGHPLFDAEGQKKLQQYRELASSLNQWIRESIAIMQDRNFPNTLSEMRRVAEESQRFPQQEVPPRQHEKERVIRAFQEIERTLRDSGESLDRDLMPESLDRNWQQMMMLYQERHQIIQDEIARLEKLQRLAEKINKEAQATDVKLDDIEACIEDEAKRIDQLHPKDAKNNCDAIERELHAAEEVIKSMFNDVQVLRDNRFGQANELHRRVQQVHEKWVNIRTLLQTKIINVLNIHTNPDFKFLAECTEWVHQKLKQVKEADYGTDVQTVKAEYERHQKEHKVIDQFQGNVEKCREAEVRFHGEELKIYGERMTILQKAYNELLVLSNKRVSDLHTLHDFITAAHSELTWLKEKEDKEVDRDWAEARNMKLQEVEKYYEELMSQLERRETQFSSVQDRGESLIIARHPATPVIQAHMETMQSKWSWLLQLTLCLETHLRHVTTSVDFFQQCSAAEEWMKGKEELLNTRFALSEFKLEEGENLLKEMQELRDELSNYEDEVQRLIEAAGEIVPLRARRERLRQPIDAVAICAYQSHDFSVQKDEVCSVRDNSNKSAWKVSNSSGRQGEAPGVIFLLTPPDAEAIDTAEKLKRHYDRVITLWQKKHLRMRQNMIFATIKVVKSWDFQQYLSMEKEQRIAIRRALNEDSEKLIQEGEPNDPQLKRLQREIDEVNRLFDEWERRAAMEDERRNAAKAFNDVCSSLEMTLDQYEKQIVKVCKSPLPRDVESLQTMVIDHQQFEQNVNRHEPEINQVKNLFDRIPNKTPKEQQRLDKVLAQWDRIWQYSAYYVERLKVVEVTLTELEECTTIVTEFEMKLASYDSMPGDMDNLRKAHDDLMTLEAEIQEKQPKIDQLQEDVKLVRPAVEQTRQGQTKNPDVDRLEEDCNRLTKRWGNCCMQVVERLRSCEAALELLEKYQVDYRQETNWMDELDSKLKNLEELEAARAKEAWEKHVKAVQEKFRQAGENLESLNDWLNKVEKEIARQEVLSEDVESLKTQISAMKLIKTDVDDHNRPVNNTLDIIAELVETGSDVLSSSELNGLQAEGKQLKERYEHVQDISDKLVKRQVSALEEFNKFSTEMAIFRTWLEKAYKTLEDKERQLANLNKVQESLDGFKAFVSDVMTHGADLKFLTISGQKFVDLSKEYISFLNEFRVKLRSSQLKQAESKVSAEVTHASQAYHDLLDRVNKLSDRFSRVGNKSKDYNDAVERAKKWLAATEPKVSKFCNEPIGAEPRVVEDQLTRAKAMHSEILINGKLIEDAKHAASSLLDSLGDQMSPQERRQIEQTPVELQQRYNTILDAMANWCADLEGALAQSRGVEAALNDLAGWLDNVENQLKNLMKPASLIRERLNEQMRQVQVLQADIDSHEGAIQKMNQSAQEFVQSSKNVRESKKIETKVKEVQTKFQTLVKAVNGRTVFLNEVSTSLDVFTVNVEAFDEWYIEIIELLESPELLTDESGAKVDEIAKRKDKKRPEFEDMMKNGKNLVGKKDVTDTTPCKDTIKELEEKWRELADILGERQNANRARKQSLNAYEALREQVNNWLNKMERKLDEMDPIALEPDLLKRQIEELKPLVTEHGSYSKTIEKLYELGMQYDAILTGAGTSPSRRPSVSPRRPSMSPSGMGGIGSRRSSAVPKFGSGPRRESQALQGSSMLRESPIQGQLEEVSNRYDMIGIRLGDRNQELANMSNEIKLQMENLKKIHAFLEKQEKNFPRDGVPSDKKEADKQAKQIKGILDQMYENQPLLDETKVAVKDILRKNPNAPGAEKLDGLLGDTVSRWRDLQDKCKQRLNVLDELKDFNDLHDNLNGWMNSKARLLNVLGPVGSDPRVVENQISQLAVMREEFNEKVPTKDQYNGIGESLIEQAGGSDRNIEGKLDGTQKKWDDLDRALQEKENALKDIIGPTRDFMALANKLSENLTKISDDIDDIAAKKADPSEKLRVLEGIAGNLDNQRPLLADVQSLGDQLQEILTDPAAKSEVKAKVAQVERQFNNCERKLGNGLAELENAAREGKEFNEKCQEIMDMLNQFDRMLSEKLAVSADKDILQRQIQDFEPLYHEIMGQEHEVIMLINRGRDLISRAPKGDAKNTQKNLDTIEKQWQKIKKTAQDRQKRLNTSMEYCKKYVTQQGVFVPWLDKAEQTLERMRPISFQKAELQKQEKELQAFRNDVNRHSSDYDGTHSGGNTFVDSCDVDKEIVKEELAIIKERWDHLNMSIAERAAAISDVMGKLGTFNDDARDLDNNMQRMEGKLNDLDKKPQDAKTLDAIKGMLDDTKDLDKLFGKLENEGEDLINDADHLGSDASNIKDTLDNMGDRLNGLRGRLEDKADDLKNAGAALGEFNEFLKDLANGIGMLDDDLNKMGPIARDLDTLHYQLDEVQGFLGKVNDSRKEIANASKAADDLISKGFAPNSREIKDSLSSLSKQVDKLDQRGRAREKEVDNMIMKVQAFNDQYGGVMNEIHGVIEEEKSFGSIGGDIATIKRQQDDFKQFQRRVVEAVGKEVEKTNRSGQGLIQSAASGVNTSIIEEDLEKMNELWNTLKQNISDREKRLAQGMLQSGKFQEALNDLLSWFDSMEDMINNQKPPSSDYKVVKAQVQEQKFVAKLLGDRKSAIDALLKTGAEIAQTADPTERRRIEGEMSNLKTRYQDLNKKCQDRMDLLEDAMQMAKEYQDKLGPLEKWLDITEKKVKDMEVVPTEEDQIQKRINEHDKLHTEILGKQPSFDDVADIATALMQVVGEEDAQGLADKIEELTNRYGALVNNSDNIHQLLQDCMNGLRNLVFAYEDLLTWMEGMDKKLEKYRVLSVFQEKLLEQMEEIHAVTEEVVSKQEKVDEVLHHGSELMKHIASEEALQLKDKLDSLQRKYNDLATKAADLLKNAQEMLPLVQTFHQSHNRLSEWMTGVEGIFQSLDTYTLEEQEMEIKRLEQDVVENRPQLESINLSGPQLCQMSPGEGARTIEDLVTRDNRRFDAICEQIQRRSERIQLAKQRSGEIITDLNELLDWFREVENQIREADPPSSEADVIRVQLKEQKALNDDIASQKGRVRDVLAAAKKLLRESAETRETEQVKEKSEDLKETMETVIKLSSDRLSILEQALPLSEHFHETHNELNQWLDEIERETMNQLNPGMRPDQIAKQQEINRSLMQSVQDHKPVLDRLNKTGGALLRLVIEDDAYRIQEIMESDNERYNNLKAALRERQAELDKAMQECSQFTDQLDGMLNSLQDTADQVRNAEPVAAHCEKIKEQMDDNNAIIEDLSRKQEAYEAVKKAASDIINKAPNKNDPAIKDIKKKLDKLNDLWKEIETGTKNRSKSLEDALALAEKFWDELQAVMNNLRDIQEAINNQEPPAIEPKAIEKQKDELKNIKKGMDKVKPSVDKCKDTGKKLLNVVGDAEKPELRRHIDDLDNAWGNVTGLYAKREKSLIDAMERAMEFHDMLQSILDFLKSSERKFDNFGPIASDIDAVKKQIGQLKDFKDEVDPWMIKVEALNRRASDLCEYATPQQARAIKEPLSDINRRWDDLNKAISTRQKELENALLRLGQFQHALNELLAWIESTNKTVNTLKPVYGDPQVIEVELAKLKVMVNDIQAHQSSVDTLNDAGRQIIETDKGTREASHIQQKLNELNTKWNELLGNAESRQVELEDALKEAQAFAQEIQDMLLWLNDVDAALSSSKPVGGLPETAKDQLDRFMEVFKELEGTGPKVEALLGRGNDYLKKSKDGGANNLQNNLRTLKSRWDNILTRASDKKIKLEIALKEAIEFHDALQAFIEWLTEAEKKLGNLKPVSRVLSNITIQIEEHKEFQNEVSAQRETMLSLDKKGTHLKYFSQKQDVILIKNLLVSVQNRWEKVVSKSAERTRALDYGFKEAKEFHESWEFLCTWLDEAKVRLEEMGVQNKNDPSKIKREIERLKDFQKELSGKQPMYDATMKNGKVLTDKAPKPDHPVLKEMLTELKNKWLNVCNLSVEKQRKLEEALLLSGQFKDALKALMDWLKKIGKDLDNTSPVHGDLDTVISLVEKHKNFEEELNSRTEQYESLTKTAEELLETADREDKVKIQAQLTEMTSTWENIWSLSQNKTKRLEGALSQAEELHKSVNMLLEWLSDAEMKLRFSGPLPEDEDEVQKQIEEHQKFMAELKEKERDKDFTLNLAREILSKCHPDAVNIIKHWITIIEQRWDEISTWALQRLEKLEEHLKQLKDLLALLDELMQWLIGKENILTELEQEPLPDDSEIIKKLIDEHQEFMDNLSSRQPEIDAVCKPMRPKSTAPSSRKTSKIGRPGRESRDQSPDREPSRRTSRISPGSRDTPDRRGAPRFPDRKSSRASVAGPKEDGIKNPRARALWDKWRHVWMMAWERDRRLKEKLGYLHELEKVKNFNWDEWRKRFLKHHNNKKSRVTDLFRKLDEDADGYLTRDDFIEGILKNKFASSRLEMNAVADKFDHGDGMIDWREFIAALRPDWEDRGPLTDTERIDDEINRQVALCTCRQKFKVFQVGEGKYRFGDSQKLRLVRILRSTVMVRVGGGWMALDEFLVKNDPCRAKGRTNVELREQFTLASGVSQSMTPFKSKPRDRSPSGSISGESQRPSVSGPITKIKEKSERSLPMPRQSINPDDAASIRRYRDEQMGFARRQSGIPGSRGGSRPSSRAGSNLSLNSDDSPRGSNVRRSSSMRGNQGRTSLLSQQTPVGFGSSSPRRISTPVTNGAPRSGSNASMDRNPMSGRMRSKSYITPRPSKLIKTSSQTNIPVFVGCYSANTSKKNSISNASTPVRPNIPEEWDRDRKRSMIPRFVGNPRSTSAATTPTFTSAIAEECKKISMAYMNENEPRESDLLQTGGKGEILDLGDEETNALIDKIMQGTEESGDIIDLDFLLSGVPDTQSEPSATPARSRTSSNSSIPIPTNLKNRTRTPTGTIQRSGSNLGNRSSNTTTTTAYGADGSRVTTTRTSSSYQSSAQAGQQSERNW